MKIPTNDPLIDEIRAARDRHASQFGYDLKKIFRDIKQQQESSGRKYVQYPPRSADASNVARAK